MMKSTVDSATGKQKMTIAKRYKHSTKLLHTSASMENGQAD
jgi:hypothetical protein